MQDKPKDLPTSGACITQVDCTKGLRSRKIGEQSTQSRVSRNLEFTMSCLGFKRR